LKRETLEKFQVLVYLLAVACGMGVGAVLREGASVLEALLWPALGLLIYSAFTQVPMLRLREAASDARFMAAALAGNFAVVPAAVWVLLRFLPGDDPAIRLGAAMVLLVPCTDWFIAFTHLGKGDTGRAVAFAPLSLILQLLLLPVYLWLFFGGELATSLFGREIAFAFGGLVLCPLVAAALTERWVGRAPRRRAVLDALAWCPVPLLALVVFVLAATQIPLVLSSIGVLWRLFWVFAAYLAIAGGLARALAGLFRLPPSQGRVLAFSFGSRNSFVVLPLALALPSALELAVVVVVLQSLVELVGMACYLWWVPAKLFPDAEDARAADRRGP